MTWAKLDVSMTTLPPPPADAPVLQADNIISAQGKPVIGLPETRRNENDKEMMRFN